MSTVVAFFLIVEYLSFLFYDFYKNRSRRNRQMVIRMLAGLTGALLVVLEVVRQGPVETSYLVLDITAVVEILLLYPCSFEKPGFSLCATLLLEIALVISFVFSLFVPSGKVSFRSERIFFSYIVVLVVFSFYFSAVAAKRFSGIRLFFRNSAVWHNLEDYSRFIYSLVFMGLGIYSLCSVLLPGKEIIKGNLRTSVIDKAEEDKKMNNLYRRVLMYMNEQRPYLNPSFRMEDMAEELYSNKLYLSRTINLLSGRNFRQFINYHRVQYAISLFKKDPRLKVGEVSMMSGFHSSVSFNMAFKVNTGQTPSEWLHDHAFDRM